MRTPAGKECSYFYGDYRRGRHHEECRLLRPAGIEWRPALCESCPIPEIQRANACENMVFEPRLERRFLILSQEVRVDTYCKKCNCDVKEPRIGCGQCHPLPDIFIVEPGDTDTSS